MGYDHNLKYNLIISKEVCKNYCQHTRNDLIPFSIAVPYLLLQSKRCPLSTIVNFFLSLNFT